MTKRAFVRTVVVAASLVAAEQAFAARYKEKAVDSGGAVQGTVRFEGTAPALPKALIGKDNDVCGEGEIIPNPVTVSTSGELSHVVVYLKKVAAGKPWPKKEYVLDQNECSFIPYLQVVPKGAELTINNNDPVLHNVHPFEIIGDSRRTLFNLAQPKQNQSNKKKIKTRRGNAVELSCDAHSWMAGWLYVLEHPYYSVVGADGKFNIGDIPPGEYQLIAWHPVLGTQQQDITVGSGAVQDAAFQFSGN